jgi:3-methyladenine DNA glycosylase AlkD
MTTVDQVLAELKKRGTEQTRKTFIRHGVPADTYGVKIGDLKPIAKQIKGNQALACALYESGQYDAMYLAAMVADGSQMSKRQLDNWAKNATCGMLSDYAVAWVTAESPFARELAMKWMGSRQESIASSGWCTYSGIVATTPDERLDLAEIKSLLDRVAAQVHDAPNAVRSAMVAFVIAVGSYVKPLLADAKRTAKAIGEVSIDMGDTACKAPNASAYIAKVESMGRVGKKRKTMRC